MLAVAAASEAFELRERGRRRDPDPDDGGADRSRARRCPAGASRGAGLAGRLPRRRRRAWRDVRLPPAGARQVRQRHGTARRDGARTGSTASPTRAAADERVELAGVWTHFATADEDDGITSRAARPLPRGRAADPASGIPASRCMPPTAPPPCASPRSTSTWSAAASRSTASTRSGATPPSSGLEPALSPAAATSPTSSASQRGRLGRLRPHLAGAGRHLGRGRCRSATATVSGAGSRTRDVLIGGRPLPLVGTISMDNLTVDLGPDAGVERRRSRSSCSAPGGEDAIRAEELAGRLGTINYEITCGISPRVPRPIGADRARCGPSDPARGALRRGAGARGGPRGARATSAEPAPGSSAAPSATRSSGGRRRHRHRRRRRRRGGRTPDRRRGRWRTVRALRRVRDLARRSPASGAWTVDIAALRAADARGRPGGCATSPSTRSRSRWRAVDPIDPLGGAGRPRGGCPAGLPRTAFDDDPLRLMRMAADSRPSSGWSPSRDRRAGRAASAPPRRRAGRRAPLRRAGGDARRLRPAAGAELLERGRATAAVLPELAALRGVEQSANHHLDVHEHTIEVLRRVARDRGRPAALRRRVGRRRRRGARAAARRRPHAS